MSDLGLLRPVKLTLTIVHIMRCVIWVYSGQSIWIQKINIVSPYKQMVDPPTFLILTDGTVLLTDWTYRLCPIVARTWDTLSIEIIIIIPVSTNRTWQTVRIRTANILCHLARWTINWKKKEITGVLLSSAY